ncbi:MAG: hypothetical protein LBK99_08315 [Opitutaceae bacterium]|nr:hypothetical protein [Opitutaceae bacterium]
MSAFAAIALCGHASFLSAQSHLPDFPQIPNGEFVQPVQSVSADAATADAGKNGWHPSVWNQGTPATTPAPEAAGAFVRASENGLNYLQLAATSQGALGWTSPVVPLDETLKKGFRVTIAINATSGYAGNYPWAFVAWSKDGRFLSSVPFQDIKPLVSGIGKKAGRDKRTTWREFFLDIPAASIPAGATHLTLNLATHADQASGKTPAGFVRYATVTLQPVKKLDVRSPLVRRAIATPAGTYFTYPHSNGFWRSDKNWDANTFVVGRESEGSNTLSLMEFDPATGHHRPLAASENTNSFYCITDAGLAIASTKRSNNALVLLDLTGRQPNRILTTAPAGTQISHGADILPDGSKAAFALWKWKPKEFKLQEIDIATGAVSTRMTVDWTINHVHYHPFDPSWISLCNEVGGAPKGQRPLDRIWAWHPTLAPQGKRMFDPHDDQGRPILITHERALYHKPGVIGDVVSPSPGQPRGLWEVNYDGTRRVIAEGKGFQHCNISRDGRWAVADVVNQQDRTTMETCLIDFRTGKKEVLYAGRATKHPWHAHPHISPDGKYVILNDSSLLRAVALEIDQTRLEAFLK